LLLLILDYSRNYTFGYRRFKIWLKFDQERIFELEAWLEW
jgi:hypothetical protein